jgi:hypothetical protein
MISRCLGLRSAPNPAIRCVCSNVEAATARRALGTRVFSGSGSAGCSASMVYIEQMRAIHVKRRLRCKS